MAKAQVLTDAGIRSAIDRAKASDTSGRSDLPDAKEKGLVLRVSAGTGAAVWYFVYRRKGKPQPIKYKLGAYTDLCLADARKMVAKHRRDMIDGIDPAAKREADIAAEAAKARRVSFLEAGDAYLADRIPKPANRAKVRLLFVKHLYSALGATAVEDVTAQDVMAIHRKIKAGNHPTQAQHAFAYCRAILNYAVDTGWITASPLLGKRVEHKPVRRNRVLSSDELRAFWTRLERTSLSPDVQTILRLQLLLGQRIGEVSGMMRHEIDLEARTWTIPAARSKNKHRHVVPLPPMAMEIVRARMEATTGRLLFPNKLGNAPDVKHIANNLKAAMPVFGFTAADGSDAPFTTHDLRRTVSTRLRELKFGSDVRDAVLNHVTSKNAGTEGNYNHADIALEVREALTVWGEAVRAILGGGDPFAVKGNEIDDIEERARRRFANSVTPLRLVG